jgi:pyruvate-ferredoxin/flavodoxin oxidoreductase
MIDDELVAAHRARGLNPEKPMMRGTAQNPDVYFQGRETVNPFYDATPGDRPEVHGQVRQADRPPVQAVRLRRRADAEHVVVVMGSGAETVHEPSSSWCQGREGGLVKVRLYRPSTPRPSRGHARDGQDHHRARPHQGARRHRRAALHRRMRSAIGEAMQNPKWHPQAGSRRFYGGRYGLGSKEFTPAMVKAVFDNAARREAQEPLHRRHQDDVTGTSLEIDPDFTAGHEGRKECMFYGLGSDGTVGANKNSIKIIGEETDNYAQGYFVYDSKKAGAITVSHLRFGKKLIRSPYLCTKPDFVACHNFSFLEKYDMLANDQEGRHLPAGLARSSRTRSGRICPDEVAAQIIDKRAQASTSSTPSSSPRKLAWAAASTPSCRPPSSRSPASCPRTRPSSLSRPPPRRPTAARARPSSDELGRHRRRREGRQEVKVPRQPAGKIKMPPRVPGRAPEFVQKSPPRSWPSAATTCPSRDPQRRHLAHRNHQYEKRNIATRFPSGIPTLHPVRPVLARLPARGHPRQGLRPRLLENAPATFKSADAKGKDFAGQKYTIQVAPEDCTGCGVCVQRCPAKNKADPARKAINMEPQFDLRAPEAENFDFFLGLPEADPTRSSTLPPSRARSCAARSSSSPAPAPAAARRPTSSCSRSSSATAC